MRDEYTFQPNISRNINDNVSSVGSQHHSPSKAYLRRQSLLPKKPTLDQGRKRLSMSQSRYSTISGYNPPELNQMNKDIRAEESSSSDEPQSFQISVNIGGQKKQIMASVDSKPDEIASMFIKEHKIDQKYQKVLSKLIDD